MRLVDGLSHAGRHAAQSCVDVVPSPALGFAYRYRLGQHAAPDELVNGAFGKIELVGEGSSAEIHVGLLITGAARGSGRVEPASCGEGRQRRPGDGQYISQLVIGSREKITRRDWQYEICVLISAVNALGCGERLIAGGYSPRIALARP